MLCNLRCGFPVVLLVTLVATTWAQSPPATPERWNPPRNLRDRFHPWTPPDTLAQWEAQAAQLRIQVQVAAGLWPFPEKTPLQPVIHGSVDRGDYTVEKVSFASRPGQYVTGNLYRPKNRPGKLPAVASPYGHWAGGRFQSNEQAVIQRDMANGAEQFAAGAQAPLQARMVQLARMGCVGFLYDMVGYGDETALEHRQGFADADAHLRLHGHFGLQGWNSIRVVDFLCSLPDVDPTRIAVTGASGGGTQSIELAVLDSRVRVIFPAVSASTGMQGGCVCENACYLRLGINNVALAALCAPRPLGMTGANDWTIDLQTKGFPELRQVYSLFGHPELVTARVFSQFPHNINQPSREVMYAWMHEHLGLSADAPLKQTDFTPLTREELTVYDASHPRPSEVLREADLRARLREEDERTLAKLRQDNPAGFTPMLRSAARVMVQPWSGPVVLSPMKTTPLGELTLRAVDVTYGDARLSLNLMGSGPGAEKKAVLWLADAPPEGTMPLTDAGWDIASLGLFLQQDAVRREDVRRTLSTNDLRLVYGYNRPILSERTRDVQAAAWALRQLGYTRIVLVGTGEGALPALLAAATAEPGTFARVIADVNGFSFSQVRDVADFQLLPGALKYGGLGALAGLAFPTPLSVWGISESNRAELQPLREAYQSQPEQIAFQEGRLSEAEILKGLASP